MNLFALNIEEIMRGGASVSMPMLFSTARVRQERIPLFDCCHILPTQHLSPTTMFNAVIHHTTSVIGRRAAVISASRSFATVGSQIPSVKLHSECWFCFFTVIVSFWCDVFIRYCPHHFDRLLSMNCIENFPPEKMWVTCKHVYYIISNAYMYLIINL